MKNEASISPTPPSAPVKTGRASLLVAAGIFLSRIAGLIRERFFAHFFGNSEAADVFRAALRIPNFLQNLFGEGVLSASFIPVYARLRAEGKEGEARQVAIAIGLILLFLTMVVVSLGVIATPHLVDLITPGFSGVKRDNAIALVRILFPGTGLLVISAWCLGVLNSHGRFFLSYTAPVLWNLAIIGVLFVAGQRYEHYALATMVAFGVVLGSIVQTVVQIPTTVRLLSGPKITTTFFSEPVKKVLKSFGPVVIGRGVVQISAYVDSIIASFLPTGALAGLAYAQTIYLLPISLFGISVSAAELPALSSIAHASEERNAKLMTQLNRGLKRVAFFVIPCVGAFIAFGDLISDILFRTGRFTADDSRFVWGILAGASVGLLAATMGRLYSSAFYAMHDTRTPLRCAVVRVLLGTIGGYFAALSLPEYLHLAPRWGIVGLATASGIAGIIEYLLLQRALDRAVGRTRVAPSILIKLWLAALVAVGIGSLARWIPMSGTFIVPCTALGLFGATYLLLASLFRVDPRR